MKFDDLMGVFEDHKDFFIVEAAIGDDDGRILVLSLFFKQNLLLRITDLEAIRRECCHY